MKLDNNKDKGHSESLKHRSEFGFSKVKIDRNSKKLNRTAVVSVALASVVLCLSFCGIYVLYRSNDKLVDLRRDNGNPLNKIEKKNDLLDSTNDEVKLDKSKTDNSNVDSNPIIQPPESSKDHLVTLEKKEPKDVVESATTLCKEEKDNVKKEKGKVEFISGDTGQINYYLVVAAFIDDDLAKDYAEVLSLNHPHVYVLKSSEPPYYSWIAIEKDVSIMDCKGLVRKFASLYPGLWQKKF